MKVHEKIRELRIRKGFSQENMAEMLEMSSTNYGYIEQGRVNLTVKKLIRITETLGTNIFELLSVGEKKIYYIYTENQQDGQTNGSAYLINDKLPQNYQLLVQENIFLKEKLTLLEEKIKYLEKIIDLSKD